MGKTDLRHARSFFGDEQAKKIAYRELINERLIVQQMRASGKTKSEEFRGRIKALKTVAMGNRFLSAYRKEYTPSDNEVRSFFPQNFTDLDLRIFFAGTFDEAAKTRKGVMGGEDMESLVREKSVGPGAEKGGLIKRYISNTYIPDYIEKEAFFSGKGWVSTVFETPLGYAFIRVEESRDLPPEKIAKAAQEAVLRIKQDAGKMWIEEAARQARISVDEGLIRELDAVPPVLWKEQFRKTVAEVGGEKISVQDLYWYIFRGRKHAFPKPGSGEVLGLLTSLTKYIVIAGEARAKGIDRTPSFKEWIRMKSDQILFDMYLKEIARSVRVRDEEAREFFQKNRENWKKPAGRQIREVQAPNREMALHLFKQLKENPEDIDRFAADPGAGGGEGKALILYRGRMDPEDEKLVFGAPVGELVGPYPRENIWVLIVVDREVGPEDDPAFADHAEEVRAAVRKEKVSRTIRKKADELYRKAAVLTRTEVLDSVGW
jgi:parvulin-like peptidyl-prolyl isomerase